MRTPISFTRCRDRRSKREVELPAFIGLRARALCLSSAQCGSLGRRTPVDQASRDTCAAPCSRSSQHLCSSSSARPKRTQRSPRRSACNSPLCDSPAGEWAEAPMYVDTQSISQSHTQTHTHTLTDLSEPLSHLLRCGITTDPSSLRTQAPMLIIIGHKALMPYFRKVRTCPQCGGYA